MSRNLVGLWVQNVTRAGQSVTISHGTLDGNSGIGIGMAGASRSIIISGTEVKKTLGITLPVVAGGGAGAKEVGDGLTWLDKSQATVDGLTLRGNARASLLIDGEVGAGSSVAHVTQSDGDDAKGIVQQRLPPGGASPAVGAAAAAISQSSSQTYAIPLPPTVPSSTAIGR